MPAVTYDIQVSVLIKTKKTKILFTFSSVMADTKVTNKITKMFRLSPNEI